VLDCFVPVRYEFGGVIVREGDPAEAFYVLVSGAARVLKRGDNGEDVPLNVLLAGDGFGERSLLEESGRSATVRASSPVEALRLDRSVFHAVMRSHPEIREGLEFDLRRQELSNFLRMHSAFTHLTGDSLGILIRELKEISVEPGEAVFREGDSQGPMYIVRNGKLSASRVQDGVEEQLAFLRPGDFFGERSLLLAESRALSVKAATPAELFVLSPTTFARLMEADADFRAAVQERVLQYDYQQVARIPLDFAEEILPAQVEVQRALAPTPGGENREDVPAAVRGVQATDLEDDLPKASGTRRRFRRFSHVYQLDEMDCGAAALAIICRHFGRRVSITRIRELVFTAFDGTSLMGIAYGARALGLEAQTVKASKSRLDQMPLPAIVHWEGNHWFVLYDVGSRWVRVSDPASGLRRFRRDEFETKWSGYAALFGYTPAFETAPEGGSGVRWLLQFLRPHRAAFVTAFLLAVLAAGLEMSLPVFSGVIVDRVLPTQNFVLLQLVVLGMVGVLLLSIVAAGVQRLVLSRTAVHADRESLDVLAGTLLNLPASYFATRRTGDIERRLNGLRLVRQFLVQNGVAAMAAATQVAVAVVIMFLTNWTLAVLYLAVAPLYVGLMRFSARRLRPTYDSLEDAFGKYQSRQIDSIKGIETVKAMGAEKALRRLLLGQFNGLSERLFRADITMLMYQGAVQMVTFLSLALFLWIGALQVLSHQLTVGGLVSFNGLVLLANGPIGIVLSSWDQFQYTSVLLNRLNDILESEPEQGRDHSKLVRVPTMEGHVRLRQLGFAYPGPLQVPVLEDISLDVMPGTTVAIVGRSGSGKTTLIKCLAALLEPTAGTISYDGVDLTTLDYRALRRQIGFVLQENHLFDATIAENIAFGDDEPEMERVAWAANIANAAEFIERLPLGYETRVGETGLRVSGGQQQRIAIARAVYHQPPVLIFDEATSSLDSESERAVKQNLDTLLQGRTSFIIAHRLSTVRDAGLIVVLERGRLVEQGTHDDLIERRGLYFYLLSQQLQL
jgi:ATP-binding cassette subfamily B protein